MSKMWNVSAEINFDSVHFKTKSFSVSHPIYNIRNIKRNLIFYPKRQNHRANENEISAEIREQDIGFVANHITASFDYIDFKLL